jgi:hypothetical protein
VYSERTRRVLIQESVGILDMEPPCTKHILAQYRGLCPQCKHLLAQYREVCPQCVRDFPQPFNQDSTFAAVTSTGLMTTSKAIPTSDGNKSRGKSLVLFLEDVISFKTALNDPDRSTTSLRNTQGELRTIIARESGMLEMMRVAVVQRAAIMEDLISCLEVDLQLCSTQAFAPTRDCRPVIEVQQRPLLVSDEGEFDKGGQDEEDR